MNALTELENIKNFHFKNIKWARINFSNWLPGIDYKINLHSNYTEQQLQDFMNSLFSIDYDNGFGTQELFGIIVMKDNTWYTRGEYDGSEWWEYHKCPKEPQD